MRCRISAYHTYVSFYRHRANLFRMLFCALGPALGGGFTMAKSCCYSIISSPLGFQHSKIRFAFPFNGKIADVDLVLDSSVSITRLSYCEHGRWLNWSTALNQPAVCVRRRLCAVVCPPFGVFVKTNTKGVLNPPLRSLFS